MKWIVAAILMLFVALALNLTLLVYAMYAIIAILVISKWITGRWTESIQAERTCDIRDGKIGDTVPVTIKLKHDGKYPIAWVLVEDMLEQRALVRNPPALGLSGTRLAVFKLSPGESGQLI